MSAHNINLAKTEVVRLGSKGDRDGLARALWCKLVSLQITYLGLPLGFRFKEERIWDLEVNRFEKRLA